jgi:hypothetical protein
MYGPQDTGKYCFGVEDTLKCLDSGAVELLLVWENLEHIRFVLKRHLTHTHRSSLFHSFLSLCVYPLCMNVCIACVYAVCFVLKRQPPFFPLPFPLVRTPVDGGTYCADCVVAGPHKRRIHREGHTCL